MIRVPSTTRWCKHCLKEFWPDHVARVYCPECQGDKHYSWWTEFEPRLKKLLQMAKHRAKEKDIPCTVTLEYLIELWAANKGCCSLTGIEFDISQPDVKGQPRPEAPSIDRINPKIGYVSGNVRLVTYHMNVALSEFGTTEFERLMNSYRDHTL